MFDKPSVVRICVSRQSLARSVGLIFLALVLVTTTTAWPATVKGCFAEKTGDRLFLGNDSFRWQVDLSSGVRADFIENLLTGVKIDLGKGPEWRLRFSGAEQRIELLGWKMMDGGPANEPPDRETGFAKQFYQPDFDDSQWPGIVSPWVLAYGVGGVGYAPPFLKASPNPGGYNWYRVRFDLPAAAGKPVCLGLGGCGLYDFGRQRFFLNGVMIGQRNVDRQEWTDSSLIVLNPGEPGYSALRFAQTNALAVQAWSQFDCRPTRLRELDPGQIYDSARLLDIFDQFVSVGPAYQDISAAAVRDVKIVLGNGDRGRVQIVLGAAGDVGEVTLNYEWTADEPALRKWLEFKNTSGKELLLLDVDLGDYRVSVPCTEGFRGFPVYVKDEVFCSMAHPAGVAQGSPGRIRLRHFPGQYVGANATFVSKQAVYGVAKASQGRQAFWDYLLARSKRRAVEGTKSTLHYDGLSAAWGRSTPWGHLDPPSEKVCMETFDKLEQLRKDFGLQFDYYWWDAGWPAQKPNAKATDFNEIGFPSGPEKCLHRLSEVGIRAGLYTSRCPEPPAVPERAERWKDYISCQTRDRGFQGVKFDGGMMVSFNKEFVERRLMLPGKYSVEFLFDGRIDIYKFTREQRPETWIFGYWGHDSPWWLLYVDTTFDHGINMEMQNVSMYPTLYERDSVMLSMDQAHQYRHDVPPRGRDSLGVWMGTGWAGFGHERWLENLIMDVSRGHGILHLWADIRTFSAEEAMILSRMAKVFKDHPDCFANSRPIIGDPWKGEPYGYSCSNGGRAFIAVNNPAWLDRRIDLRLDESIGLAPGGDLELYRHAPGPARMRAARSSWRFGETVSWSMRPFEVVLLELVPAKKGPALPGPWQEASLAVDPPIHAARELPFEFEFARDTSVVNVRGQLPPCPTKSILALVLQMTRDGKHWLAQIPPVAFCLGGRVGDRDLGSGGYERNHVGTRFSPWIVYRIPLEPSEKGREADICLMELQPKDVKIDHKAYWIPGPDQD